MTDNEYEQLEQDERTSIDEAIAAMILTLNTTRTELENELRRFYQRYGTDGVVTYQEARRWVSEKDHRKRMAVLLLAVAGAFSTLKTTLTPSFKDMLLTVISKEKSFFGASLIDLEKLLEVGWGADNLTWDIRLADDIDLWLYNLGGDIRRSLLRRESLDDVLEQLEKRFGSMENVLTALGLTEATAVGSMTRKEIFRKIGITKYRFYTQADERTCKTCGAMHGMTFPMSAYQPGVTASPLHTRCRCFEIPVD